LLAGTAGLTAPFFIAQEQKKRNLLCIATDDLNNCLSAYGHPIVRTPNIDRIAKRGVRFDHAYCQFPLCSPSRSSMFTGLSPDSNGIYDLTTHFRANVPDVVTLPQLFRRNGYYSARSGKIYHYNVPMHIGTPGLDDPVSWQETVNPNGVDHTREELLLTNYTPDINNIGRAITFYASGSQDEEQTDGMTANAIIEMLENHASDPFFLGAGFFRPHIPWIAPSKYFDMYPLEQIQVPQFDESEMYMAPEWAYFTKPANWGMTAPQRREAIRAYYATISFVDAQVGKILNALDRLKLTDNTTILFFSDNGYMLGEHGQWQKWMVFENSARVPLIIAGAGVTARGQACSRTVELLDVYPTIAELCGLEGTPQNLQGRSLTPLLADPATSWDHPAVSQVTRPGITVMGYSVRTERHRYTAWGPNGSQGEELYDYRVDPREVENLANDQDSAALKAQLHQRLDAITRSRPLVKTASAAGANDPPPANSGVAD